MTDHVWVTCMSAAVSATQKVHWNTSCHQQRHSNCKPGNSLDNHCHLWAQPLEILTGCLLDLETGFPAMNLCYSFVFIEIPLLKCLTSSTMQQKSSTTIYQQMIQLVLNEQKATQMRNGLTLFKEKNNSSPWTREGTDRFFPWPNSSFLWALFQLSSILRHVNKSPILASNLLSKFSCNPAPLISDGSQHLIKFLILRHPSGDIWTAFSKNPVKIA